MCTFLVLMIPESADLAHAKSVAASFGFEPGEYDVEPHLPKVWKGAVLLDPDGSHCYCGTHLGRAHRTPRDRRAIERKAWNGKRARWSESKRAAWIAQQLEERGIAPELSRGVDHELDRWVDFAEAAVEDRRIGKVGVVVQEFHERVSDWQPAVEVPPSLQILQLIPRLTPTWFV